MNSSTNSSTRIAIAGIIILGVVFVLGGIFWDTSVGRSLNAIVAQVEICETTLTQSYNTISETAQVTVSFEEFGKDLFREALGGNKEATNNMIAFMTANSGTDLGATHTQLQQVIEAQRGKYTNCVAEMQRLQLTASNKLEGTFGRNYAKFWEHPKVLPLNAPARPLVDLDGDGKITALDYPAVTAGFAVDAHQTGEDPGTIDLFGEDN